MISVSQALKIHDIVIEKFGGASGLRDEKLLKSALERPFQTFDGKDLYPTPITKSSAILESILMNHPFVDGNKRTGYVLFRLVLNYFDFDIHATQEEKYEFVISITTGERKFEEICLWVEEKIINIG